MKNIIFEQLENKRKLIKTKRSLTYFEIERLKKDFITDYIYNSNAIEGNSLTLRETAYVLDDLTV